MVFVCNYLRDIHSFANVVINEQNINGPKAMFSMIIPPALTGKKIVNEYRANTRQLQTRLPILIKIMTMYLTKRKSI